MTVTDVIRGYFNVSVDKNENKKAINKIFPP